MNQHLETWGVLSPGFTYRGFDETGLCQQKSAAGKGKEGGCNGSPVESERADWISHDRNERDRLQRMLEKKNLQLCRLAAELTRGEERERKRLAQLLHDHIQQLLVGARYSLEGVRRSCESAEHRELCKALEQVEGILGDAIGATRTLTYELSPPVLSRGGMASALVWLGQQFEAQHQLEVKVSADPEADVDDENVRAALFHAVKELLFNAVKHARVKTAHVRLKRAADDRIEIVVEDQGVGFDPAELQNCKETLSGFGLQNLRERLELFGGRLDIASKPNQGSRLTILAPLRESPIGFD